MLLAEIILLLISPNEGYISWTSAGGRQEYD
jgi:hypothetical protein